MKVKALLALTVAGFALPVAAQAKVVSGSYNGMSYTAESRIVGVTSTATVLGGGDPIYFATDAAKYSGTVALIMTYATGASICTGSLMSDRRSILTAAHCVSDGTSARPLSTTAYFYGGADPDVLLPSSGTAVSVSDIFVNGAYTGEVIDQNDIAVLRLSALAPAFATAYDLYDGPLGGSEFNVAGVGGRSDTGGSVGANLSTGRRRQGDNRFDFRLGDDDFAGGLDFLSTGGAEIEFSWVSDFDNGLAANDASCKIAGFFALGGAKYCNLGVGPKEVGVAGGDSGGPEFIGGKVAAVTSYGLTFGTGFGDFDSAFNSSFGEFSGYVPVSIHKDFITRNLIGTVPEPATWAMMIAGFGMVGGTMRARRRDGTLATA